MSSLHLPQIEVVIVDDEVPTRELLLKFRLVLGGHCRDQQAPGPRTLTSSHVTMFGVGWVRVLTADRHSNAERAELVMRIPVIGGRVWLRVASGLPH